MLFSLYPHITQNYFILCFLACLGVLQWTAARHKRLSLSLLGPWGLGWPGMVAGLSLTIAAFGWFFWTTLGLFQEGLAGGELSSLFAAGGGSALLVTRLAGLGWQKVGVEPRIERKSRMGSRTADREEIADGEGSTADREEIADGEGSTADREEIADRRVEPRIERKSRIGGGGEPQIERKSRIRRGRTADREEIADWGRRRTVDREEIVD